MTLTEFQTAFPNRPLILRYVERGPHDARIAVWVVNFHTGYFTSDTDRLVNHDRDDEARGFGATVEEAIDDLVSTMLNAARGQVEYHAKRHTERMAELEALLATVKL